MLAGFLAVETVAGKSRFEHGANGLFGRNVGLRHRRAVGLERDGEIALVEALYDNARGTRRIQCCSQFFGRQVA